MLIKYVEEAKTPVPEYDPPTPNGRAVLELLRKRNATLDEIAGLIGLTAMVTCHVLGELSRGGWVGVMRYYPEEGSTLLKSDWFARRPAEILVVPAAS